MYDEPVTHLARMCQVSSTCQALGSQESSNSRHGLWQKLWDLPKWGSGQKRPFGQMTFQLRPKGWLKLSEIHGQRAAMGKSSSFPDGRDHTYRGEGLGRAGRKCRGIVAPLGGAGEGQRPHGAVKAGRNQSTMDLTGHFQSVKKEEFLKETLHGKYK